MRDLPVQPSPRRFARNARGTAAVEFAMLLPVLIGLTTMVLIGTEGLLQYRRLNHAAESVAWTINTLSSSSSTSCASQAATATRNPTIAYPDQQALKNTVLAILRKSGMPSTLKLTLRREVAGSSGLTTTSIILVSSNCVLGSPKTYFDIAGHGDVSGANDSDLATNIKPGDAIWVVHASMTVSFLGGILGNVPLDVRYAL